MPLKRISRQPRVVTYPAAGIALIGSLSAAPIARSSVVYQSTDAEVRVWAGEVSDLRDCLDDARDGAITTASTSCDAVAAVGDEIWLDNVKVWVRPDKYPLESFRYRNVTVAVSGKDVIPFSRCLQDSKNKVISDSKACSQIAIAGNLMTFLDVTVMVYK